MIWLTGELKQKIKSIFEPDYKRNLTDEEVITIAINLTDFMESYIKFRLRQNENKQNIT